MSSEIMETVKINSVGNTFGAVTEALLPMQDVIYQNSFYSLYFQVNWCGSVQTHTGSCMEISIH